MRGGLGGVFDVTGERLFDCTYDRKNPETGDGIKTVPGRIMTGIQFFEALIDDQLLSVDYYLDLYKRHGFTQTGIVEVTPVHAITLARK